jgi:hypothetical protein
VEVVEFLQDYAELHEQSDLDTTRIALGRLLSMKLSPIASLIDTVREGRATRWGEVTLIAARQRERNLHRVLHW